MIALVPMKYNSERVKDKNFRDLNGKPLFFYVLNSLVTSKNVKRIIVNTDSSIITEKIQSIFGDKVEVSIRPADICGDFVSMNKIIEYEIKKNGPGEYLQTHTTNPFLKRETIDEAIVQYRKAVAGGYDSLFTVNLIKSRLYDEKFKAINHDPNHLIRTQDLAPIYDENSNLYVFSDESFSKKAARIGDKPYLFPMNKIESIDIDTPDDWALASCWMKYSNQTRVD